MHSQSGSALPPGPSCSVLASKLCAATLGHMRDPRQVLLIPLTVFSGLEQAFFSSDFTAVRRRVA